MKKSTLTTSGFTMIETLIAIAILMISIAGPLTIAQKGLTASVYARDQVIASFLAQDVMEYIKNLRDYDVKTDELNGAGWKNSFGHCTNDNALTPCVVDTINNSIRQPTSEAGYVLYRDGAGYQTTETTGAVASQFYRRFYIQTVTGATDEVKAVVTVAWRNGTLENVVTLENNLFNVNR